MYTDENLDVRSLLLNFYSSELNAHARLIIGVSVLLFTVASITLELKKSQIFGELQSSISILCFWVISSILWYLLMRYLAYGLLASTSQHSMIKDMTYQESFDKVVDDALSHRILLVVPSRAFISVGQKRNETKPWRWRHGMFLGSLLCLVLGAVTTYTVCLFIGLQPIDILSIIVSNIM